MNRDLFNTLQTQASINAVKEKLFELLSVYGLKVLGSLVILIIAFYLAKFIAATLRISLEKLGLEQTLNKFLGRLAKVIIIGVGVLAALGNLGIDTTSFVALFTACSFAIGFAFKETLSNIAAGVLVIVFRPFVLGDYVKLGVGEGKVADVNLFSVSLLTNKNITLIIPNGKVVSDVITNYTREKKRKLVFSRTIAPEKLCELQEAAIKALNDNAYKLEGSEVSVVVAAVNAADINVEISFWVESANYEQALSSANEALTKVLL